MQVLQRELGAELDVAQESHRRLVEHLAQCGGDRLDLGMVRGHAVAHEPERARQPVEDVHSHVTVLDERAGGVHPGRSGTDDSDP